MDWTTLSFDWNHVRAFLAAAQEGSFSAAARALGLSQPTLGRQVSSLEAALGVTLFERQGKGLTLTSTGEQLLDQVKMMGQAATRMSLLASGRAQAIEGTVRITASDVYSAYILPPALHELRRVAPRLKIEIVASNTLRNLVRREADVAIRHVRPSQSSLIAQRIRQERAYLYASTRYIERHGRPRTPQELRSHRFICFGNTPETLRYLGNVGVELDEENFAYRSSNGVVSWEYTRRGLGIAVMSQAVAQVPDIERIDTHLDLAPMEFSTWLVTHRELHTSPKIRLVYDTLARCLNQTRPRPRS